MHLHVHVHVHICICVCVYTYIAYVHIMCMTVVIIDIIIIHVVGFIIFIFTEPARAKGSPAILSREIPTLMPTFDRPGFPALGKGTVAHVFYGYQSIPESSLLYFHILMHVQCACVYMYMYVCVCVLF